MFTTPQRPRASPYSLACNFRCHHLYTPPLHPITRSPSQHNLGLCQFFSYRFASPSVSPLSRGILPSLVASQALARPDDEEIQKTIQETAAALERVVQGKLSATNPSKLPNQPGNSTLIKYTPAQQGQQVRALLRIEKEAELPTLLPKQYWGHSKV